MAGAPGERRGVAEMRILRISRDSSQSMYSPDLPPVAEIESGGTVIFSTHDARGGALLDRPTGQAFDLPRPTPGFGNPVTGPVAIIGAKAGDALLVHILSIECDPIGWCGGHAHAGAVVPGRIPNPLGRTCQVSSDGVIFSPEITLPLRPMIGCIGTAPEVIATSGVAGKHGGNMDQPVVRSGTSILLPVFVEGALLYIGDVHATQGDGELSGVGLEVGAKVTVEVELIPGAAPQWPWLIDEEKIMVLTVGENFDAAAYVAIDEGLHLLEKQLKLQPADALGLLSLTSNIRVGGFYGAPHVTTRLEIPRHLNVHPRGLRLGQE
jgi:amidase